MKRYQLIPILLSLGLIVVLGSGCKKPGSPGPGSVGAGPVASAEKTSFTEVTSQLDAGGTLYVYLGTAQWLDGLSTKVAGWQKAIEAMPQVREEDRPNIEKGFGVLTRVIKDSGIEDVTGVGLSSIEIEKGLYRNKAVLHHYPGTGDGFLWKMLGGEPHLLTGLDLLPVTTAFATFSDADLPLLWSTIKDETAASGFPQAEDMLQRVPEQFEQKTQVKWDEFLKSLGGEFGLVLTLNESNTVPIPLPGAQIKIAEPGLLLAVKVNDDTIFNRIDQELKRNPVVVSVERTNLKMRTMPIPLPLAINLRPTAASSGGYLFIASSDAMIEDVLAVKSGQRPGLKSTDEFKRLAQNIPTEGNQFTFVSSRFSAAVMQIQSQVAAGNAGSSAAQQQLVQSFLQNNAGAGLFSVRVNTDSGCVVVGNGGHSAANLALLPAIAVPGLLAAIAIPNFVKARATSQENACINNLRMIDGAKQEWALENHKTATDTPTPEDLLPYVMNHRFPKCPAGGHYTIGSLGEKPTCSISGHQLE